jgi:hypothetical protein
VRQAWFLPKDLAATRNREGSSGGDSVKLAAVVVFLPSERGNHEPREKSHQGSFSHGGLTAEAIFFIGSPFETVLWFSY